MIFLRILLWNLSLQRCKCCKRNFLSRYIPPSCNSWQWSCPASSIPPERPTKRFSTTLICSIHTQDIIIGTKMIMQRIVGKRCLMSTKAVRDIILPLRPLLRFLSNFFPALNKQQFLRASWSRCCSQSSLLMRIQKPIYCRRRITLDQTKEGKIGWTVDKYCVQKEGVEYEETIMEGTTLHSSRGALESLASSSPCKFDKTVPITVATGFLSLPQPLSESTKSSWPIIERICIRAVMVALVGMALSCRFYKLLQSRKTLVLSFLKTNDVLFLYQMVWLCRGVTMLDELGMITGEDKYREKPRGQGYGLSLLMVYIISNEDELKHGWYGILDEMPDLHLLTSAMSKAAVGQWSILWWRWRSCANSLCLHFLAKKL